MIGYVVGCVLALFAMGCFMFVLIKITEEL